MSALWLPALGTVPWEQPWAGEGCVDKWMRQPLGM